MRINGFIREDSSDFDWVDNTTYIGMEFKLLGTTYVVTKVEDGLVWFRQKNIEVGAEYTWSIDDFIDNIVNNIKHGDINESNDFEWVTHAPISLTLGEVLKNKDILDKLPGKVIYISGDMLLDGQIGDSLWTFYGEPIKVNSISYHTGKEQPILDVHLVETQPEDSMWWDYLGGDSFFLGYPGLDLDLTIELDDIF